MAPPEISVVVSTRNRRARLEALLDSLAAQTLPRESFETVVVDDGSEDGSADFLRGRRREAPGAIRVILRQVSGGPAVARNEGWRAAAAPFVAFTDDDCEPDPGWLDALLEARRANPAAAVQGRTQPIPRERSQIGVYSRTMQIEALGPWFQTCNIAYPRQVLESLGGFDEHYPSPGGEDTDLAWRAIESGSEIVFCPEALVLHAVNQFGPLGKLRVALRWTDAAWIFRRHPGLRSQLHWGVFWKPSHAKLLLALAGLALARRIRPAIILCLPYWREAVGRCNEVGAPRSAVPYVALHDLVETIGAARGGARYRVAVL